MIKLIATDVDGTLVKESSKEVYPELIQVIRDLCDAGFLFCISSGRQYASVSKMFAQVDRPLYYIVENGAHILDNKKTLHVTRMEPEHVEGIMEDLRSFYKEDCHVVASAPEGSFLESKDEAFIDKIANQYRNEVHLVDDILQADVEYVKLAMWKDTSILEIGEKFLIPKWDAKVKTCMAGMEWVDFMDKSVDKGNALKFLQDRLGILPEETMAFGDNMNDVGMLLAAGESYAVESAVDDVKAVAKHICKSYTEKGVYQVLKELLEGTKNKKG